MKPLGKREGHSPIHVHVGDQTPVHVHVAKHGSRPEKQNCDVYD